MQRLEQYKAIFDGDFDYDESGKTLRLIPTPSTSGKKVYFIWAQRHTAETLPEDDTDTLLLWAKGEAKEMMSNKASMEIKSVSGYGESVTLGSSAESLMKEAQDFKSRFERKFTGSTIIAG
jgi:hypothetical protein